jgi:putative methyltransferase (TIGR04325 family)
MRECNVESLRHMLPSLIQAGIRRLGAGREFSGDYATFSAASAAAKGYDAPEILEKVLLAALKVRDGTAIFERDSVCFYSPQFRWPLLGCLLHAAIKNGVGLHVVDFGGSLGSFYFQHRSFLKHVLDLKWSIVEQSEYVRVGRKEFQDETLNFFSTLDECASRGKIDVVLFSGSLQCVENPFYFLERAGALSGCIMIDRIPFIKGERDRITVQRVPPSIYKASYAHTFFARDKFDRFMTKLGYVVFAEWEGFDKANIKCCYRGLAYYCAKRP